MSRKRPSPCKAVEPENEGTKVSRTSERTQTRPSLITHWVSKPIKESKSKEETVNTQKQPQNPPNDLKFLITMMEIIQRVLLNLLQFKIQRLQKNLSKSL